MVAVADIQETWAEYMRSRSDASRNELIEHYLYLVINMAKFVHAKLVPNVDRDDLEAEGVFGLIDAIADFEPSRGVKFPTFAFRRIRGAMIDYLREMDWTPRSVRTRRRRLANATVDLENRLGRPPNDQELCDYLRVTPEGLERMAKAGRSPGVASLTREWIEHEGIPVVSDIAVPVETRDEFNRYGNLSRVDQLLLKLYYVEEMTMKEAGRAIGLSESRVSQLHADLIMRLRERTKQ
jgi:RNA polymerase sigma factor for flagellar operon FliA